MIPTRVHGVLDYLSALTLYALPRLAGWPALLRTPMTAAAAGTAAYSLATRYEWGAVPALSMRQHLALDAVQGLAFCTAAVALEDAPREVRLSLAAYGLFALAAAALTDREPAAGGTLPPWDEAPALPPPRLRA